MLKAIGPEDDGLYQCTVANHVGYSVCVVEVKVSGGCRGSGAGDPVAGRVGLEEPGLYFGASAGSAFPLPSTHRSAKGSWEALTSIFPYMPHCGSKGPEIPWVPHPILHRRPTLLPAG